MPVHIWYRQYGMDNWRTDPTFSYRYLIIIITGVRENMSRASRKLMTDSFTVLTEIEIRISLSQPEAKATMVRYKKDGDPYVSSTSLVSSNSTNDTRESNNSITALLLS
jgi:hypothetical protein